MKSKFAIFFCILILSVFVGIIFACEGTPDGPPPVPDNDPNVDQNPPPDDGNLPGWNPKDPNNPDPNDKDPNIAKQQEEGGGQNEGGDPVNLATGKLNYSATDLVIKGRKLDVVIKRFYRNGFSPYGTVHFDGSASYDPYGYISQYDWQFAVESYDISGASTATPSCKFTVPGVYQCKYRVQNNFGTWSGYVYFYASVDADVKSSRFGYNWDMNYNLKVIEVNESVITFYNGQTDRIGYYKVDGTTPAKYITTTQPTDYFLKEDGLFTLYEKYGIKYRFDSDGCLWKIEDNFGNNIVFSYTGSGRYKKLTAITDDLGRNITLTYKSNGLLGTITAFDGRVWEYTHNGATNNLTSVQNPAGLITTYDYDDKHNITSVTDPNGQTWLENTFDFNHRIITQKYGDGYYNFTYDPENKLTILKDRTDINSLNYYDDFGSVISNIVYNENDTGCSTYSTRESDLVSYWMLDEDLSGSDCSCGTPTVITNVTQLQNIKNNLSGCYILGCDIDASETTTWNSGAGFEPIGSSSNPFTGCLDGRGYTIDGIYISRPVTDYVGMFGKTSTGSIKNIGITNANIRGQNYVGGLVGYCDSGSIIKCYTSGTVSGSNDVTPPSYTPTANGIWAVTPYHYQSGGLWYHTMTSVTATDISSPVEYFFECYQFDDYDSGWGINTSYTRGPDFSTYRTFRAYIRDQAGNRVVSSLWNEYYGKIQDGYTETSPKIGVGGVIGYSKGALSQCYSVADVSGHESVGGLVGKVETGSVTNCYSAGKVSSLAAANVGGFCGSNTGTITSCYYDSQTSGRSDTGKGTPKTTSEMKQQSTFVNWDFIDNWDIQEGSSYPYLIYGELVSDSAGLNDGKAFLPQSTTGKVGDALSFNGSGDNIRVRDNTSLDLGEFAICAWIYKEANTDYAGIVSKCDAASTTGYNYNLRESTGGKIEIRFFTGSTLEVVESNSAVSTGQWHYIVASCDGNKLRLYIDGLEAGNANTIAGLPNTGSRDLYIGAAFNNGDIAQSFQGKIDEVKIYSGAMLEYEVRQNYEFNGRFVTEYEHDSDRNISRIIYPAGNCTDFAYDSLGNVTGICQKTAPDISSPNIVTNYTYDSNFSFIETITDPRGNVTTFNYDDSNAALVNITLPQVPAPDGDANPVIHFTYNSFGQVEAMTSPDGMITKYLYYGSDGNDPNCGKLWKIIVDANETDGLNITTEYRYDMQGNVIEVKDPNNSITKLAYNALNLPTQIISPLNRVTSVSYNQSRKIGKIEREIADDNQVTSYSYDILDNIKNITNPLGFVTRYSYDLSDNLSDVNDAQENISRFKYDTRGLLWEANDANNNITSSCYNENGLQSAIIDANGNITEYDYDSFNRLTTITYPDGSDEVFTYDAASNITSFKNRADQTITYTYDALNRVQTKTLPGESGQDEYTKLLIHCNASPFADETGHIITNNGSVTLDTTNKEFGAGSARFSGSNYLSIPLSDDFNFGTDDFTVEGWMRFNSLSLSNLFAYYTSAGSVQFYFNEGHFHLWAGNSHVLSTSGDTYTTNTWYHVAFVRNGDNWQIYINGISRASATDTRSLGSPIAYRPEQSFEAIGAEVTAPGASQFLDGWIDELRVSKGIARWTSNFTPPSAEYTLVSEQGTRTYTYDIAGRLVKVDDGTDEISYYYDRIGRVEEIVDINNRSISYEYDNRGLRTKLIYPDDTEVTYEYDADMRLKEVKYGGDIIAEYSYDELSRRTLLSYGNGASITYLYDLGDNITRVTNNAGTSIDIQYTDYDKVGNRKNILINGSETEYTYDKLYQLTFVNYPAEADTTYNYDRLGNRTSVVAGSTTNYLHNKLNQYDSVAAVVYSYDTKGNLTNDGTYKYTYDCENRLTDVNTVANVRVASYTYDYLGRRISKTDYTLSPARYTLFCYDGDNLIAEYDSSNNLLKKYIYGDRIDEPIMMIVASGGETRYYYHYDGLGSVVALSNNSGSIIEKYSYDAFGAVTIRDAGDQILTNSNFGNCRMFTGRELDSETGNYYYRARYYKPDIGRFLQSDPIGYADSVNLYQYCLNNPINWIDPFGLAKRQIRPLDIPGLRNTTAGQLHHDSFKYNDGSNSGYYDNSRVQKDPAPKKLQDKYKDVGPELDDDTLRQAEENVKQNWDKETNPKAKPYDFLNRNCQDYCDAVEEEYNKLQKEMEKKKKKSE